MKLERGEKKKQAVNVEQVVVRRNTFQWEIKSHSN